MKNFANTGNLNPHIESKMITNEYCVSPNLINYKVHSHTSHTANFQVISTLNKAEVIAMKQEQMRLEEELHKQRILEEGKRKIIENVKMYRSSQKVKEEHLKKTENEKKVKFEKIKEYNNLLRDKAICKKAKLVSSTEKENKEDFETFSFNDGICKTTEKEEMGVEPVPVPMERMRKDCLYTGSYYRCNYENENNNVINIREDIDKIIKEKIHLAVTNSNLGNLENVNFNIKVNNINFDPEELNKNVENVKEFRKTGLLSTGSGSGNGTGMINLQNMNNKMSTNYSTQTQNNIHAKEENKNKNELEKRRYMKALRNLMIEKFKEKSIVIPNICSCGQLQRKLDTLLEDRNVSVYSIINIECANNCIYYNNTQDYHKGLSDIIQSVKNLTFDSFAAAHGKASIKTGGVNKINRKSGNKIKK